jgi:hypothetical protein
MLDALLNAEKPRRPIRRPTVPPGYLDAAVTARRLRLKEGSVSKLAAQEKLPAVYLDDQW